MSALKKLMAIVLILAMTCGLIVAANAADSPTVGPDPEHTYETENGTSSIEVVDGEIVVTESEPEEGKTSLTLDVAKDVNTGKTYKIRVVGDGENGVVADTKEGRELKKLIVSSSGAVTINSNAMDGAWLKEFYIKTKSVILKKGMTDGIKNKALVIKLYRASKAARVTIEQGSLDGIAEEGKLICNSKYMSNKQWKLLRANAIAAGMPKESVLRV
jgi:hypothetical protein